LKISIYQWGDAHDKLKTKILFIWYFEKKKKQKINNKKNSC